MKINAPSLFWFFLFILSSHKGQAQNVFKHRSLYSNPLTVKSCSLSLASVKVDEDADLTPFVKRNLRSLKTQPLVVIQPMLSLNNFYANNKALQFNRCSEPASTTIEDLSWGVASFLLGFIGH